MSGLAHLFTLAEAYCAAVHLSESTVSERVLKGGNRLRDLRSGQADIGVRRLATAVQWFSDNWPADVEWPREVVRPIPNSSEASAA